MSPLATARSAILLLALAVPCAAALADTIVGRIVGITDGDTLVLLDTANRQHSIRLAGIDSPEKGQDFGDKARSQLSALAFGRQASADCRRRDKYQREICLVKVDGQDLGLEQVRAGMAWWYRQYISEQSAAERANYEQAEFNAKVRRFGLWNSKNPTPPWNWRHEMRLEE